jgi:hypothetical protein
MNHKFTSRAGVVEHLVLVHGWQDTDDMEASGRTRASMHTGDGRWLQATSEYLAIHRELELAKPQMFIGPGGLQA